MDLRRLRTFVAVAERGTVSKAALHLHITQPALSRQLKELQEELQLKLFERVGRRLVLTGEGAELLGHCRSLLNHALALTERAQSLRKGDSGVLKVGASPQIIEGIFPAFLRRYAEQYPSVQVRPVEVLSADQPARLEAGEVHVAINVMQSGDARFASYPLAPFHVLAVSSPSFGIAVSDLIDIRRLSRVPLLLVNSGFGTRKLFDAACRLARLEMHIYAESGAPHTLLALAEAGYGVAIIPSTVPFPKKKFQIARVTYRGEPLGGMVAILWDKRRPLPRYAEGFAQLLAAHMQKLLPAAGSPRRRTASQVIRGVRDTSRRAVSSPR